MNDRKILINNISSLAIIRGMEYLIPVILLPYLVRTLELENFGLVNYSLSFSLYFLAIMQYGFSLTMVKKISKSRGDLESYSKIYSQAMTAIIILISGCFFVFVFLAISITSLREHFFLHLLSFIFVSLQAMFPIWFFQGMESMRHSATISMTSRLIMLLLTFIFIKKPGDYYLVPLINSISMLFCVTISIHIIKKNWGVTFKLADKKSAFRVLSEGRHAFASQFFPSLYINSSTFLLGAFSSTSAVGIYSVASKCIDIFNSLGTIISSAFYPFLARRNIFIKKFQNSMIFLGLALSVICFLFSTTMAEILFSNENLIVSDYIKFSSLGIFSFFAMRAYGDNGLILQGRDNLAGKIAMTISILFFFVGLLAIPYFGVVGAIFTLTGARCFMALGWYVAYKTKNI